MTETENLTMESLVYIRAALSLLNQITPGYGVSEKELKAVKGTPLNLITQIDNSLEIEESDDVNPPTSRNTSPQATDKI